MDLGKAQKRNLLLFGKLLMCGQITTNAEEEKAFTINLAGSHSNDQNLRICTSVYPTVLAWDTFVDSYSPKTRR